MMRWIEGLIVVGLIVFMLVLLARQAANLRDELYDRNRYKGTRAVSDRRLRAMNVVDGDDFWKENR